MAAVLCVSQAAAWSVEPLELGDKQQFYVSLNENTEYFVDAEQQHSIDDLRNSSEFRPIETPYIDFGLTPARIWLRTRLTNMSKLSGVWRLDTRRQYNLETRIFLVSESGLTEQVLFNTEQSTFSERPVPSILLTVDFKIEAMQTVDVYIAYRSSSTTYLPIGIGKPAAVTALHAQEHTQNVALNSVLIAMMVFALVLTPVIGWRLSFGFSAYILVGLAYIYNADGYTFKHLWPNNPLYNDTANLCFMLFMTVFGLLFSRALFNFNKHIPWFDKVILCTIAIATLLALLAIPYIKVHWLMVLGYSWVPVGSTMQLISGVVAIKKRLLGATPYLIGAFIVLSSIVYATIAHLVPGHFNLDTTLDYGHFALVCECVAFACAITLRLLGLRNQRDQAVEAELIATRESLALATKLQRSQEDYIEARKVSDLRKLKIENVSHDLKQPLTSLRRAIDNTEIENENTRSQLTDAFDYLENLATNALSSDVAIAATGDDTHERFAISTILDNVVTMFADEARERHINLRYRRSDAIVKCAPIKLMRIVTNLVANAVNHNSNCDILITARKMRGRVSVEVWDSGQGMDETLLQKALNRHVKDTDSLGSGLGLNIVKRLCLQESLELKVNSKQGRGTVAKVLLSR